MKTLILTCNTGQGHNSCADAIKETYIKNGEECVIEDSLRFVSPLFSKFIAWGHVTIYRHMPWMFKFGYKYFEKHPAVLDKSSGIYKLLTLGTDKLYQYIIQNDFDTVICTHVFSATIITDIIQNYKPRLKTCFVATDYTCYPGIEKINVDKYFIPDESLANYFENANIPKEKIISSGIPIRNMFYGNISREAAKEKININPADKNLLIMCGSMGCGPLKRLTKILDRTVAKNAAITIVCGNNKKLCRKLEKSYKHNSNIRIKGYVKDMSVLMDSADLYLTKPGGISVTEASVKNLPMVFIDAVAGCEEYNRSYFVRLGAAKTAANVKELAKLCEKLLFDGKKLEKMSDILKNQNKNNANEFIYSNMK